MKYANGKVLHAASKTLGDISILMCVTMMFSDWFEEGYLLPAAQSVQASSVGLHTRVSRSGTSRVMGMPALIIPYFQIAEPV